MKNDKIIQPLTDPNVLKPEGSTIASVKPGLTTEALPLSASMYDPTASYRQPSAGALAAKTLLREDRAKPLIGLYVIAGFMALGGILFLLSSDYLSMIVGIIQLILALGLLNHSGVARKLFIIITVLGIVLNSYGLMAITLNVASSRTSTAAHVAQAVLIIVIQIAAVLYLCLPKVKSEFL